jgi:CBS domain-containing protein
MQKLPLKPGDNRKRASVDTVRSILDAKGHDVESIAPGATVYEAIADMARLGVGALLVVTGHELLGIISERDYARKVILQGRSSRDTTVQQIMTPSPITVTSAQTVDDCLRIVTEKRIRHLPVVDAGELKGMVSIGDLVKTIISSQAYTIDQLHSYIEAGYPS